MKIQVSATILFLSFLIISGCDSEQSPPASQKTEAVPTEPAATETSAPVDAQETAIEATESESAEPAATETPASAVTQETVTETMENEPAEPAAEPVQQAAVSGEQVYKKSCVSCHGTGVAGSPKVGDAVAWGPRIAKGIDALYNSAKNGVSGTAMMARGTCGACSDEELEAAVDFMVSGSK